MKIFTFRTGGGTGFVGKHLIRHLKSKGLETLTVSRKSGVNTITWDDISKNGLPSGINSVVNVAGENVLDFTKRWNDGYLFQYIISLSDISKIINYICIIQVLKRMSINRESILLAYYQKR